ncbi:hypothetical protein BKA67DRAFT_52119 [Truncatella angustata]|uniref:Uncharacterized protein n=1 Tax=Truncatella angustata TaxID=152316 RepID=A0A9P8UYC7_9PEZI|nr:uncharacterized protein BKA67DRAFT_52119 [Truncatella angustata]KAH6660443.1 hypothetical protein BKA67DRAFT_52119 [Truncatella angustata]
MSSFSRRRTSDGEGKEGKDRKGLLTRWKSILKKSGEPSSKKQSVMFETEAPEVDEAIESSYGLPSEVPTTDHSQYENVTRVSRAQIYDERARRLGSSYGVEIAPSEWQSVEGDVYRVEKPVRVRVHRNCHRCQTSFGTSNSCPNCAHHFCSKCGRSPSKQSGSRKKESSHGAQEEASQKQDEFAAIVPHYGMAEPIVVTRPSKTGGQPLVHKQTRMRIRRNCHRCNTTFTSSTRVCQSCGHRRCDDCPKNTRKTKKYPYGYPGDVPGESSPAFYECHECEEIFPPDAENGVACENCAHQKCSGCPRARRRRVEPGADPDVLRSISSRFEQLELS